MKRVAIIAGIVLVVAAIVAWVLRDRIPLPWLAASDPSTADDHAGHDQDTAAGEEPRVGVEVPVEQQARIGLQVAIVEHLAVRQTIRAVGIVKADERRESHVHTRIPGYIEKLHVAAIGDHVKRGDVLYRLYSPDVLATELEYVASAGRGELSSQIADAALQRRARPSDRSRSLPRARASSSPNRSCSACT